MQKKISCGLLMYKKKEDAILYFIVHPGGPFWKNKDQETWSIPKGEPNPEEDLLEAAKREFYEETGIKSQGEFIPLGSITQKSGKVVHCWAFEGDWSGLLMCKSFTKLEWPPRSGKMISVPEVDKAGFFTKEEARKRIIPAQFEIIERLEEYLKN